MLHRPVSTAKRECFPTVDFSARQDFVRAVHGPRPWLVNGPKFFVAGAPQQPAPLQQKGPV